MKRGEVGGLLFFLDGPVGRQDYVKIPMKCGFHLTMFIYLGFYI